MTKGNGLACEQCGTSEWYDNGACKQCQRENGRQWFKANPEKTAAKNRRYRENNPKKKREINGRWQKENPGKVAAQAHRRRTRKTEAGGSYTESEFKSLCKQYGGRCACCGKKKKLTADHVIPVALGGSSDISNIQGLCGLCNSRKGTNTTDYRTKTGFLRWIQKRLF